MTPDNRLSVGERIIEPPRISKLIPDNHETGGIHFYHFGDISLCRESYETNQIVADPTEEAKRMGIFPREPFWGQAIGWKVQVDEGGRSTVSYCQVGRGGEHRRFNNVWKWGITGLNRLTPGKGDNIEHRSELVAILPVPEKPGARRPEDRGGIIIIPLPELNKEFTRRRIEGFLEPRFQGR